MARRRRRKRKGGWLLIVAVALLIAGFMARRLMMPSAARYLTHSDPDHPAAGAVAPNDNGSGEHLSDSDRRALDEVIKRKTQGH